MSLSIIVCSTKPDLVDELKRNIADTIGDNAVYELIVIDNKTATRPLAQVYNEGGRRAKYENLLFIHQDAGFVTHGWLEQIETQLATPDCGVIGFAGSRIMFNTPSGWGQDPEFAIMNLTENGVPYKINLPADNPFVEVVSLDGFALFVRREIWKEYKFDERLLTAFHCYDIDFSLSIATKYQNYVCNCVDVFHNSCGNFDEKWLRQTIRMYEKKWQRMLPVKTKDVSLSPSLYKYLEERASFRLIKRMDELGVDTISLKNRFLKYPLTFRHSEHLLKVLLMSTKVYIKGMLYSLKILKK